MRHSVTMFVFSAGFLLSLGAQPDPNIVITGDRQIRHTITFTITGSSCSETGALNPFTDYRLRVRVQYILSGQETYMLQGYFAADGNAGQTGAVSGNKWKVHFTPQWTGAHVYRISFRGGPNVALSDDTAAGTPVAGIDGDTGSFDFGLGGNEQPPDLHASGRVDNDRYQTYMVIVKNGFTGKPIFLKSGGSSPSNFLDYADFDNTPATSYTKTWTAHVADWQTGDTSWGGGQKGKGIIGALNYLSSKGVNTLSFNTLTLGGADPAVFPYIAPDSFTRFDCSKLDQWQIVFDHANSKGIAVELRTQIAAAEKLLDNGDCGPKRKLYYRELVARFAHDLGIIWSLGDENGQTTAQRVAAANYIRAIDPHCYPSRPILLPVAEEALEQTYRALLVDTSSWITGISLQLNYANVHGETKKALDSIKFYNLKLRTVTSDFQTPKASGAPVDGFTGAPDQDAIRKNVVWGGMMAGGAGVAYSFGQAADLACQNFRSYDKMWDYSHYAMSFFRNYLLDNQLLQPNQLSSMINSDQQLSKVQGYCLSSDGYQPFAVYLPNGGTASIDLTSSTQDTLRVWWYNPRTGGKLKAGAKLVGAAIASLGAPPEDADKDWAALIINDNAGNPDDGVGVKRIGARLSMAAPHAIITMITHDGWVTMKDAKLAFNESVEIVGVNGRVVSAMKPIAGGAVSLRLKTRGIYLLCVKSLGKRDRVAKIIWF